MATVTQTSNGTTHSAQDSQQLAGTRWRLDPSGSSAEFRVPNLWGLASVKGRFQRLDGWLEVDRDQQWRMELTLDAASLDTGNLRRDRHLRSADFFDVEHHPEVRFRSSRVNDHGGGRLHVEGELEAAGEGLRLQVEVDVTVGHADGLVELDAAATVDQRQLGIPGARWGSSGPRPPSASTRAYDASADRHAPRRARRDGRSDSTCTGPSSRTAATSPRWRRATALSGDLRDFFRRLR